jgi:hypothetical protein
MKELRTRFFNPLDLRRDERGRDQKSSNPMNYSIVVSLIMVLAVALLATACASNRQYRTSSDAYNKTADEAWQDPENRAIVETTPEYSAGFVEFDEEGWFWNPDQVKQVKEMIRKQANTSANTNPAGIVLLVFVHGWKNNAARDCGNVKTFRTALQELHKAEEEQSAQAGRTPRKIVGVYCGWRGLAATMEPFKELSIWDRKSTAHKVGGCGAMTQFFVELEKIQDESNATIQTNGPRTELIIVGHSFGAAAVYSAISQFVTERFVDAAEQNVPLKPLGDQVILLNPAFEASRHFNLNRLATTLAKYPDAQRPVLSIFTSQGDWATHHFLPLGQFFATMFESFQTKDQRHATREAVGWYQPFVTHTLEYNKAAVLGGSAPHSTYNVAAKQHLLHNAEGLGESVKNVHEQRQKWVPNNTVPQTYEFDDCILKPRSTFRPGDPFLVVAVDKQIMKDHDDINNKVMVNFLREYIQFCHQTNAVAALPKSRLINGREKAEKY